MHPAVTHAVNKNIRGSHILKKRIELGDAGEPNVVSDHLTYIVPEAHSSATFEAATIYTPVEFSRRLVVNFSTGDVEPATVTGEQGYPVILATPDGSHAVGIFSSALPQAGLGYGTFGFSDTNKINCVFRENNLLAGQSFHYVCDFVFGTLSEVKATIIIMHDRSIRDSGE
jgi:hypothetical protein